MRANPDPMEPPVGEEHGKTAKRKVLEPGQREEITRRVLAGERANRLGEEFGVSRAYVSLLKKTAQQPERFRQKKEEKLSRKLTAAEEAAFQEALATETPESHGLLPLSLVWSMDHARQLAKKLFGKEVSVRVLNEMLKPLRPEPKPWKYERPQPPGPRDVRRLSPELAADPEFVAWYLSPIAAQIEQRSYEAALKDYDERYDEDGNLKPVHQRKRGRPPGKSGDSAAMATPDSPESPPLTAEDLEQEMREIRELEGDWPDLEHWPLASDAKQTAPPVVPAPGLRIGKHAKNKGSNYTPPRKKKKRR